MNIGLLVTRNEERIIKYVLDANIEYVDKIYAIDASNDNTYDIIKKYDKVVVLLRQSEISFPEGKRIWDWRVRRVLLNMIKKNEKIGDWITLLHGDEIFYHNPKKVIEDAEKEGANGVEWYAMHFFLHTTDKKDWNKLSKLSPIERVTWYSINDIPWIEFRQFKLIDNVNYDINLELNRCHPNNINRIYSKHPIYKHYKEYCINQHDIYSGRWGGLKNREIFVDKLPDYKYSIKFNGSFGKFEKGLEHLR